MPIQTVHIGRDKKIQLDLVDLAAKLVTRATEFREADATRLELTPEATRFARVSTTVSLNSDAPAELAVLCWDLPANGSLSLLFCDRPCRLRASSAWKSADDFEFDALSAGLVWMLTKRNQHLHFMHTRAVNARPALVICPPEAIDKIADTLVR